MGRTEPAPCADPTPQRSVWETELSSAQEAPGLCVSLQRLRPPKPPSTTVSQKEVMRSGD